MFEVSLCIYTVNPADTWFCKWQRFQEQDANWAYRTVAITLADRAWCFPSQLWRLRYWWTWSWRVLQEWILQEFFLRPDWSTAIANNDHIWNSEVWVQSNLSNLLGEIFFLCFLCLKNILELKEWLLLYTCIEIAGSNCFIFALAQLFVVLLTQSRYSFHVLGFAYTKIVLAKKRKYLQCFVELLL